MKIKVKKVNNKAIIPQVMREGDAGFDLYSVVDIVIKPGERVVVNTGIALAIPSGYWGNIRDRSGLAAKHGLHTLAGVIDSNYRGEIMVTIVNLSQEIYKIKVGDRIAQMIIEQHKTAVLEEVVELDKTNRGEDNFASSGY